MVHAGDIMSTKKIADRSLKNSDKVSPKDSKVFKHEASAITLAKKDFHIVGIGASAGGLKAFEEFFRGMPTDAELNMAFVLVQHLAPDHKSILAELIRRYSSMSVFEVEDGMKVQANCIYIIPPRFDMSFCTGTLQLLDPIAPHGQRLPIDFFFRSLAHGQQERTIGLVLSGTGSDGTQGIRAIKGEGGMVMVQTPESAEFDGMPQSAIATGMVDYQLSPSDMGARLIAYVDHFYKKQFHSPIFNKSQNESVLKKIFVLLRNHTSHDFSQYKPSTINRRIERRLAVHHIQNISNYVRFLQSTPTEIDALFYDLLIGVTHFFRDTQAFMDLEKHVIPKLFADASADKIIRVWSVGCSTGEEAYSIAILFREHMEKIKKDYKVQLFATDIDSRAIVAARTGRYPANVLRDISEERLQRFFTVESDGSAYRIHKVIRDMLIFSEQDVIMDPPFSRLDLLCCRNLLIYLNAELQERLVSLFHFTLRPGGVLMLGTSEGIGKADIMFEVLNRKQKLFKRKDDYFGMAHPAYKNYGEVTQSIKIDIDRQNISNSHTSFRELTERALITKLAPASVLFKANGDILYLHGQSGAFLELLPGEVVTNNVLKMAREGLRYQLKLALHTAVSTKVIVRCPGLKVKSNDHFQHFNMTLCPVMVDASLSLDLYLYLMLMEVQPWEQEVIDPTKPVTHVPKTINGNESALELLITGLQEELRAKDEYLKITEEELETSNEELKSSSEEMQSINEELQSTNEELETSKEELQSINEELSTVNNELQTKVIDLSIANNDMNNLLAGTRIATVFVDQRLQILRFTPTAHIIINMIASDVGRPVGHIASNLIGYKSLVSDIQSVLDTLVSKKLEVQTTNNKWYAMNIQPYRTLENVIEGAVISFVDITEVKTIQLELQDSETKLRSLFDNLPFGVAYHVMIYNNSGNALDYRFLDTNESYQILTGLNPKGKTAREAIPGIEKDPFDWLAIFDQVVSTGKSARFEQRLWRSDIWCDCIVFGYKPEHFVTVFINITERKQTEEALAKSEHQMQQLKSAASVIKD
jgi:two-component system CheB/CheR fusion protein